MGSIFRNISMCSRANVAIYAQIRSNSLIATVYISQRKPVKVLQTTFHKQRCIAHLSASLRDSFIRHSSRHESNVLAESIGHRQEKILPDSFRNKINSSSIHQNRRSVSSIGSQMNSGSMHILDSLHQNNSGGQSRSISTGPRLHGIQENISSSLQLKKRLVRKKRPSDEDEPKQPGVFNVIAYSTADEYDLEALVAGLQREDLYEPRRLDGNVDVVHAVAKYKVEQEPREIFFFREGSCVMWNMTDLESCNLLAFLRPYEHDRYSEAMVQKEAELMNYKHQQESQLSKLDTAGDILIAAADNSLEKYTFSNAIALSVKLGIWEASLEKYIDTIEFVTEDLKRGTRVKMTRDEALRKHGELFALRHVINLSSDLLDVPDFYWDRERLEVLYTSTCSYFSIARRTRVMNEKINHCVELIELLSSHLSDKHHVRLEWMIIVLIMVEVGFEMIHYADRYLA